ncbi:MAG: DUF1598 domain-containing protein [Planctomycetota bacterium]|nr:DUF1598 domain-containing protein [Planctomycetota bacterium]MDA1180640.1 DUF1598 domain-containing protein [Planctomycetota bacterium]
MRLPSFPTPSILSGTALILVGLTCSHNFLPSAHAQSGLGNAFRQPAVGGISIDPSGILQSADPVTLTAVRSQLQQAMQPLPEQAQKPGLRNISLRKLELALQESAASGQPLPDSLQYLAGLQRVEYVFVDLEHNDIILAGPGEPWFINDVGIAVGQHSRTPVVLLDDLLVALRSVHAARLGGISCSIDPRPEGVAAMQQFINKQKQFHAEVAENVEQLMGPQLITVQGVPQDSHFARVLVGADYKMKRIAMRLDPSPLKELPSYLDMLQQSRVKIASAMPRWWLACSYDALGRGSEGLSWQIRGVGVKAMTETELVDAQGNRKQTGKSSHLAQKWADSMSEHFEHLAAQDSVFGQLRNVMDLCVVAALLEKEGLYSRAACECPTLRSPESGLAHETWSAARQVATQCSIVKRGKDFIISASGGVQIGSWQVLDRVQDLPELDAASSSALTNPSRTGPDWWWN